MPIEQSLCGDCHFCFCCKSVFLCSAKPSRIHKSNILSSFMLDLQVLMWDAMRLGWRGVYFTQCFYHPSNDRQWATFWDFVWSASLQVRRSWLPVPPPSVLRADPKWLLKTPPALHSCTKYEMKSGWLGNLEFCIIFTTIKSQFFWCAGYLRRDKKRCPFNARHSLCIQSLHHHAKQNLHERMVDWFLTSGMVHIDSSCEAYIFYIVTIDYKFAVWKTFFKASFDVLRADSFLPRVFV